MAVLLVSAVCFAESYANVTYAEGGTFRLVRGGVTTTWDVATGDVFGMEIFIGDMISTGPDTMLELSIHPVSASVQIAENTSYACNADGAGGQSRGELYYGRVHAKVAKLSGSNSFRITSPSLVAGVRGTDFGCDVIAVRPGSSTVTDGSNDSGAAGSAGGPDSPSPLVSRVFCFEGSVAVNRVETPALESVVVSTGEMVETVVQGAPVSGNQTGGTALPALEPVPISGEIKAYWQEIPSVGYLPEGQIATPEDVQAPVPEWREENGYLVLDRPWPRSESPAVKGQNVVIPSWAATALICLGTSACTSAAVYSVETGSDEWFVESGYSAGWVMTGTGALLAVIAALFN